MHVKESSNLSYASSAWFETQCEAKRDIGVHSVGVEIF